MSVARTSHRRIVRGGKAMMNPKEFKEEMERLSHFDVERRHIEMDNCMAQLLTELGYGEGVEIFHSVERWYA